MFNPSPPVWDESMGKIVYGGNSLQLEKSQSKTLKKIYNLPITPNIGLIMET